MATGIGELKQMLLDNIDKLIELLEHYNFCHIAHRGDRLRFARNEDGGQNIEIRLTGNEWLNCADYVKSTFTDLFNFIHLEKGVPLRDVFKETKRVLNLGDNWQPKEKRQLFDGIYSNIGKSVMQQVRTYPEEVLDEYIPCGNELWLSEGITLEAMRFYDVRFSVVDNAIVFPWRNQYGEIISVKARLNEKIVPSGTSKYYYKIQNSISSSLFNYSHAYEYLYGADVVYCVESEKTCMKLFGWGIKNVVAIGSHSLSQEQIKLLLQLQCKEICLLLDKDLPLSETKKNADAIRQHAKLRDIKLSYWNWEYNLDLGPKSAPVDGTLEQFKYILENEIEPIEKLSN